MLCVNRIPFDLLNVYLVPWCVYFHLHAHVLINPVRSRQMAFDVESILVAYVVSGITHYVDIFYLVLSTEYRFFCVVALSYMVLFTVHQITQY